jgi:ABC-2 type transport system ATP-binding protein
MVGVEEATTVLGVTALTRSYGETRVLDDVTFDVKPGRVTGFVGANGAGKTTTMRIIMGVLAADSGQVLWDGDPVSAQRRRSFGYMPEERGLYPKMKLLDQLVFFARLHGASRAEGTQRAGDLLDAFGLGDRTGDALETLSLGNQQRVQIAAALVHRPSALVLDEPFSGLDPIAVESIADMLRHEVSARIPLLFSSHQLELVERLCDDLVILSHGAVVAAGSADVLRTQGPVRLRVVFADGTDAGLVRELRGVTVTDVDGATALLELDGSADGHDCGTAQAELLATLVARAPVREFGRVVRPLSEIFREVIR